MKLRTRTLASIKPEISLALSSLLDELQSVENANILRYNLVGGRGDGFNRGYASFLIKKKPVKGTSSKSCPLCKAAGRSSTHYLSECKYLPESDRCYLTRARQVSNTSPADELPYSSDSESQVAQDIVYESSRRVNVEQSPFVDLFSGCHPVMLGPH